MSPTKKDTAAERRTRNLERIAELERGIETAKMAVTVRTQALNDELNKARALAREAEQKAALAIEAVNLLAAHADELPREVIQFIARVATGK